MNNERDPNDNYQTPDSAVHQLLSHASVNGGVWDPSCGRGAIVQALLNGGVHHSSIMAHDKYEYTPLDDSRLDGLLNFGLDLLDAPRMPDGVKNIVMNPPYSEADRHVRHCLHILHHEGALCVLLRLTWIAAQKRADLLKHLLKIIMVGRLKMLPPDVPDKGHNGTVDFAWFVFVPYVVESTRIVRAA
jgi:hypothetical protein